MTRALWCGVLLSSSVVFAQSILLDRVVALVDGEPILRSEVQRRLKSLQNAQSFDEARDALIDEKLIKLEAKRLRLASSPEEIDRALASMAELNKLTVEQLMVEVRKQGFSEQAYRRMVEDQIVEHRWLNMKLEGKGSQLSAEQLVAARAKFVEQLRTQGLVEVMR